MKTWKYKYKESYLGVFLPLKWQHKMLSIKYVYAQENLRGIVYSKHQTANTTGIPERKNTRVIKAVNTQAAGLELIY